MASRSYTRVGLHYVGRDADDTCGQRNEPAISSVDATSSPLATVDPLAVTTAEATPPTVSVVDWPFVQVCY
jgi:hypothetical protein